MACVENLEGLCGYHVFRPGTVGVGANKLILLQNACLFVFTCCAGRMSLLV